MLAVTEFNTIGTNTVADCEFRNNYIPVNSLLSDREPSYVSFKMTKSIQFN